MQKFYIKRFYLLIWIFLWWTFCLRKRGKKESNNSKKNIYTHVRSYFFCCNRFSSTFRWTKSHAQTSYCQVNHEREIRRKRLESFCSSCFIAVEIYVCKCFIPSVFFFVMKNKFQNLSKACTLHWILWQYLNATLYVHTAE